MQNQFERLIALHAPATAAWSRGLADEMLVMQSEARAAAFQADARFLEEPDVVRVMLSFRNPVRIAELVWPDVKDRPTSVVEALRQQTGVASAEQLTKAAEAVAIAERRRAIMVRFMATGDSPSPPPVVAKVRPKEARPPRPVWQGKKASMASVLEFLDDILRWVRREMAEVATNHQAELDAGRKPTAFGGDFEVLVAVLELAGDLKRLLTYAREYAGDGSEVQVDEREPFEFLVTRIAEAALEDWRRRHLVAGRECRDLAAAATWWEEEFLFAEEVEAPVRAGLEVPAAIKLPTARRISYNPSTPMEHQWTGIQAGAVIAAYARMRRARTAIRLLRAEIERTGRPDPLRCNPTDADAIAREMDARQKADYARFRGLGRYRFEILSGAAFVAPILPYSDWMIVTGRRGLGDVARILGEAGLSGPVIVASAAAAAAVGIVVACREWAKPSYHRRRSLYAAQAFLGAAAWVAMLWIPVIALAPDQRLPDRLADGKLEWRPAGRMLAYVHRMARPLRDEATGQDYVAIVAVLRGSFSRRLFRVTEEQLDLLRAGTSLGP